MIWAISLPVFMLLLVVILFFADGFGLFFIVITAITYLAMGVTGFYRIRGESPLELSVADAKPVVTRSEAIARKVLGPDTDTTHLVQIFHFNNLKSAALVPLGDNYFCLISEPPETSTNSNVWPLQVLITSLSPDAGVNISSIGGYLRSAPDGSTVQLIKGSESFEAAFAAHRESFPTAVETDPVALARRTLVSVEPVCGRLRSVLLGPLQMTNLGHPKQHWVEPATKACA